MRSSRCSWVGHELGHLGGGERSLSRRLSEDCEFDLGHRGVGRNLAVADAMLADKGPDPRLRFPGGAAAALARVPLAFPVDESPLYVAVRAFFESVSLSVGAAVESEAAAAAGAAAAAAGAPLFPPPPVGRSCPRSPASTLSSASWSNAA